MKNKLRLLVVSVLSLSAGLSEAAPRSSGPAPHARHTGSRDRDSDRGPDRGPDRRWSERIEVKAQAKLRRLGYYRGPVDGHFGKASRYALIRFQREHRLRGTGQLDRLTVRALRL